MSDLQEVLTMFNVDDIPDQVLRDIVGAYHRRLASTDTENQPEVERDFQRMVYLRTALEWLALWLNEREPAAQPVEPHHIGALKRAEGMFRAQADAIIAADPMDYSVEMPASDAESVSEVIALLTQNAKPASQPVADDVVRDAIRRACAYYKQAGRVCMTAPMLARQHEERANNLIDKVLAAQQQKEGGE